MTSKKKKKNTEQAPLSQSRGASQYHMDLLAGNTTKNSAQM